MVYPTWGTAAKMVCFGEGAMKLCTCENAVFFSFFLSIYSRCGALVTWPHDTLPCVLIIMTGELTHTASNKRKGATHPRYINHHQKSEVFITLRCQLCSTRYTALRIKKKHLCNQSSHYEKYRQFLLFEGKPSRTTTKSTHFALSAKMNGTQRRTLVSP